MLIETNEVEYCKLDVHYEIDLDTIEEKRAEVANKLKQTRKIPGFRDGKASLAAIKHLFKDEIKDVLANELASEAIQNTIVEKNLKPFGNPSFSSYNLDDNKFTCNFSMHIQPDLVLGEYKGFEIPKPVADINANELAAKTIQDIRMTNGETRTFEENDVVAMGDNIVLKYTCQMDGKKLDRLSADNELVIVGKTPIPGFDEQLVGMRTGEEKEFEIKLPEEANDVLKGKMVSFQVKAILGSKITPAPLDDNLAKKVGTKDVQDLLGAAKAMSDNRVKELENGKIFNQITSRLVANHDTKIPGWFSLAEAQLNAKNNGENWDTIEDFQRERYLQGAERSIKLSLVLNKIREEEPECCLTQEEQIGLVRKVLAQQTADVEKALETIYKNNQLAILMNRVNDEYTLGFIRKTCTLIE